MSVEYRESMVVVVSTLQEAPSGTECTFSYCSSHGTTYNYNWAVSQMSNMLVSSEILDLIPSTTKKNS